MAVNRKELDAKEPTEALMRLRFQNYNPRTEDLKKYCEDSPDPGELLRQVTEAQEELIKATNQKFGDPALDLDNLVPRKGNWDIKRSLASKLERLEHRTQRAILEILQEKVRENRDIVGVSHSHDLSSDEE